MSIFRENYRHEVEARYKEAVQDRLRNLLDLNDAKPSIFTRGALAAVHRDVRSNARRQHSEDDVNGELGDIWDKLQRDVQALTLDNIKEFLEPDETLRAKRAAQDASVYDEAGEKKIEKYMSPGHGR